MTLSDTELARALHKRARRALLAGLASINAGKERAASSFDADGVHRALTLAVVRFFALSLGHARGLFENPLDLERSRLFAHRGDPLDVPVRLEKGRLEADFPPALSAAGSAFYAELALGPGADGIDFTECPVELLGNTYELLLGESVVADQQGNFALSSGKKRKQTGTFFTPRALTEVVVSRALAPLERRARAASGSVSDFALELCVCDPAVGGGAFLLEVARALCNRSETPKLERKREIVSRVLYGVDINPLAVAVAEAALCLFVADPTFSLNEAGRHLRVGDALLGRPRIESQRALFQEPSSGCDFLHEFAEVFARGGFDLVIGNPPWVAYAGRAAQPLDPERRAYFSAHYASLKGYPTLHGLFVERALKLAPNGVVALVVPSPIADLQGYRAVRRVVRASHTPSEPMLEFGQDAFESVTQPCFALIAEAGTDCEALGSAERPFRLAERQRAFAEAMEVSPPAVLLQLAELPTFPRELFGEMGFQTTTSVTKTMLLRAAEPDARHDYPLLEGRDVREFSEGSARLFLALDPVALAAARCRVRARADYERAKFVIRQTARFPIAALHQGLPFRNSLLAGFAVDGLPPELVVGLLNSALYRALHLALQRDARQAVFPQVKIAHLRALPRPPANPEGHARIARLTAQLTGEGSEPGALRQLDAAVFSLFSIGTAAVSDLFTFLAARGVAPR